MEYLGSYALLRQSAYHSLLDPCRAFYKVDHNGFKKALLIVRWKHKSYSFVQRRILFSFPYSLERGNSRSVQGSQTILP